MKVVILAGGKGTRLVEETSVRPKPMVEIGGRPILWHLMRIYAHFGYHEFLIALGYKAEEIRHYFAANHEKTHASDSSYEVSLGAQSTEPSIRVRLIDTGLETNTGGRVGRLCGYLRDEPFLLTWSDGLGDVDMPQLVHHHRQSGGLVTVTAVHPPPRFGLLTLNGSRVLRFQEKPCSQDSWINGAFFVVQPDALDYIHSDESSWERDVLAPMAEKGQLMAYRHEGFWQCMDTLAEKRRLEDLWQRGEAPWKIWSD